MTNLAEDDCTLLVCVVFSCHRLCRDVREVVGRWHQVVRYNRQSNIIVYFEVSPKILVGITWIIACAEPPCNSVKLIELVETVLPQVGHIHEITCPLVSNLLLILIIDVEHLEHVVTLNVVSVEAHL